jgi:sugar lactone lactonase YvrE
LTVGITQPLITAPNQFYLTAPATLGTGSATVLVSAGTFSTSITVNMEPALAIVNDYSATTFGQATLYEEGSATPLVTLTQDFSTPNAAVFDPSGNLFISNLNGAVTEYSPPYTGTPTIISSGVSVPVVLAEDASGDLYVANNPGSLTGSVEEFAPGATTPSRTITAGISEPASMCVDPSGNLYVVDSGAPGGAINEFAPGATTASSSLTGLNFPQIIVCDPSGYTYVAYYGNDFGTEITDVTTYSPGLVGFSGLADITGPESLATDSSGNIYAGNGGGSTLNVLKFGTHGTGLPTETITAGLHLPKYIQVDAAGNIFVYDSSTNGVLEYDSGQTALSLTIPSPINYDIAAIALSN